MHICISVQWDDGKDGMEKMGWDEIEIETMGREGLFSIP